MIRCGSCKRGHETVAEVRECASSTPIVATGIRCASCKGRHATINEVRACHSNTRTAGIMPSTPAIASVPVAVTAPAEREAWTGARIAIAGANSLRELRDAFAGPASATSAGQPMPQVPDGYYAVEMGGTLKFYKVRHGRAGSSWAGYTFVDVQAGDDLYPIRSRVTRFEILSTIAADPRGALARYERELGVCGHCGRTLTDEQSRALGIGPICRDKV